MGSFPTRLATTMSTKGQVILPKPIRDVHGWGPGTRLTVEETPDGVILRTETALRPSRPEDVFGSLKFDGPAKTIEEMNAGITREVRRRHERGRY